MRLTTMPQTPPDLQPMLPPGTPPDRPSDGADDGSTRGLHDTPPLRRQRLLDGWPAAWLPLVRQQAQLHLAQDGSATRLCETVAGGPVTLTVHGQAVVEGAAAQDLPASVRQALPGSAFLQRRVSLSHRGVVMMDNLSWIALATVPDDVAQDLLAGRTPIGHLLARLWIRRQPLPLDPAVSALLWASTGLPDEAATRSYVIHTPDGPVMHITECFRRGVLDAGEPRD
ncbi:chorismate--pyruvate lyase family protein [Ideonella livida]|uniref:DUF98 domain-containing protein n=1 Tax=Ideonella livida TaxID=2707176 RepID=A0A7C9PJS6_9BURK|nr:chorismate pyruvate-lyase family protein [Ideonella livida]NDY93776.1 DUF98 domain-containing protein [Ideonella livida]